MIYKIFYNGQKIHEFKRPLDLQWWLDRNNYKVLTYYNVGNGVFTVEVNKDDN